MRGSHHRGRPAARLAVGLALALALSAAASYAAVRPAGGGPEHHGAKGTPAEAPTIPVVASASALRIVDHPAPVSTRSTARFRVVVAGEAALRCRLDRRPPKACAATSLYRRLAPGPHAFSVQARRPGRPPLRAGFAWTVLEPKPFTVEARPAGIGPLYPGAAPLPISVIISNPNPVAITVTALRVSAGGGAPGCDPATNVALTAPDLGTARLQIPAHGSLTLPSGKVAAPTIGLRELDQDQDACQGAGFDLSFSGSAGA